MTSISIGKIIRQWLQFCWEYCAVGRGRLNLLDYFVDKGIMGKGVLEILCVAILQKAVAFLQKQQNRPSTCVKGRFSILDSLRILLVSFL